MTISYPDPPTFADVIIKEPNGHTTFNPLWIQWFTGIINFINQSGGVGGTNHNSLQGLQGGQANQYFHFTSSQYSTLVALISGGYSGSVTLAKLTTGGTNGTLTFTNGLLTGVVAPS